MDSFEVGNRVKITENDLPYAGTIVTYDDTHYKVSVDGLGKVTSFEESDMELLPGGGGGGVTILFGTSEPSAGQGENGEIYLRYLPNEYVPVEYIQSDGSQYIDTQYSPTVHTAVELKLNAQNTQESAILGSGWQINGFFLMFYGGRCRWHSGTYADSDPISLDTDYTVKVNNTSMLVNEVARVVSPGIPVDAAIRIFSTTIPGDAGASNTKGSYKLYYLNITEDNVLVRHMIPVKRTSDNTPGLYDTINGVFYVNGGTGDFAIGQAQNSSVVTAAYAKVNGIWQPLIGTDINDINLG